jgi:3-methyladenine DNA glycosylase AlkD
MNLNKSDWTKEDGDAFRAHIKTYAQHEKIHWARKILNTSLELYAIPTPKMKAIAEEIRCGNVKSFLDLKLFCSYESIAIYGMLLTKLEPFSLMVSYLDVYKDVMENWAHVDLLSFHITQDNKGDFLELSHRYLQSDKAFVRRLGLMILFQMLDDQTVLPIVYHSILKLEEENAYYVIMMAGWLLSECVIKYKDQTLDFIVNATTLNHKIVNKCVQKCRESRRLTVEEKDELIQYKKK